jgi:hypothetical protein
LPPLRAYDSEGAVERCNGVGAKRLVFGYHDAVSRGGVFDAPNRRRVHALFNIDRQISDGLIGEYFSSVDRSRITQPSSLE